MTDISGLTNQDASLHDLGSKGQTGSHGQHGATGAQGQFGSMGAQGQFGSMGQTGGLMGGMSAERAHTGKIAQNLSVLAFRQWEKALTGIFSLPAAVTLGAAATALYTAAFLERAFELFEISVSDIGGSVANDIQKMRAEVDTRGGIQQQSQSLGQTERTGRRMEFRGEVGQQRS